MVRTILKVLDARFSTLWEIYLQVFYQKSFFCDINRQSRKTFGYFAESELKEEVVEHCKV